MNPRSIQLLTADLPCPAHSAARVVPPKASTTSATLVRIFGFVCMGAIIVTSGEHCKRKHWRIHNHRRVMYVGAMEMFEGSSLAAIGARLELTRSVLGMSQREFCGRAHIPPNTYNQFERGKKRPSIENALALCDAHGLTLDWIYRGEHATLRYSLADAIVAMKRDRCRT